MIVQWATMFFSAKFQRYNRKMREWIDTELLKNGPLYTNSYKALLRRAQRISEAIQPTQDIFNRSFDAFNSIDRIRENKARLSGGSRIRQYVSGENSHSVYSLLREPARHLNDTFEEVQKYLTENDHNGRKASAAGIKFHAHKITRDNTAMCCHAHASYMIYLSSVLVPGK
jgi:hypothetical protein